MKLHKSCVIAMWQILYSISEYPYIYRISGHGYTSMLVQTGRQGWHNLVIPQLLFSEKVKKFKGKLLPFRQNRRPILYPNILLNLKFSVLRRSRELARCNASGPFGAWHKFMICRTWRGTRNVSVPPSPRWNQLQKSATFVKIFCWPY